MGRAAVVMALVLGTAAGPAAAQQAVEIVGSSTLAPFVELVIDRVARTTEHRAVKHSTGTGAGLRLFCAGGGPDTPDIAAASRPITEAERRACAANGVREIVALKVGLDGIVVASSASAPPLSLSRDTLFRALARSVERDGAVVANPYRNWRDLDPALPDLPIRVIGPPPTSGTRDAFVELAMLPGCEASPVIAALPPDQRTSVCTTLRDDGVFVESGEDDAILVEELVADPGVFGIFGYGFLEEAGDELRAASIEGADPSPATIASGEYPLARPLFLYAKAGHAGLVPGMKPFLAEFTREAAIGPEGYLADAGLVTLPEPDREAARRTTDALAAIAP